MALLRSRTFGGSLCFQDKMQGCGIQSFSQSNTTCSACFSSPIWDLDTESVQSHNRDPASPHLGCPFQCLLVSNDIVSSVDSPITLPGKIVWISSNNEFVGAVDKMTLLGNPDLGSQSQPPCPLTCT